MFRRLFISLIIILVWIVAGGCKGTSPPPPPPPQPPPPPGTTGQCSPFTRFDSTNRQETVKVEEHTDTSILILRDVSSSVTLCGDKQSALNLLPSFVLAVSKNFHDSGRSFPEVGVAQFNDSYYPKKIDWVLEPNMHLDPSVPSEQWLRIFQSPLHLRYGENYEQAIKQGLVELRDMGTPKQKLLVITDASSNDDDLLKEQIRNVINFSTSEQEIMVLALCPSELRKTNWDIWTSYAKFDGKLRLVSLGDEDWFPKVFEYLFDGFLSDGEKEQILSYNQKADIVFPTLGRYRVNAVVYGENESGGVIDIYPDDDTSLKDGEVGTIKSIVLPVFSPGTCQINREIVNKTSGFVFYWFENTLPVTPSVKIKPTSNPDDVGIILETSLSFPGVPLNDVEEMLSCISPSLITEPGGEGLIGDSFKDAKLFVPNLTTHWDLINRTHPQSLVFFLQEQGTGKPFYETNLYPTHILREARIIHEDDALVVDMNIWFPDELLHTDPVRARRIIDVSHFGCPNENLDGYVPLVEYSGFEGMSYSYVNEDNAGCNLLINIPDSKIVEECAYRFFDIVWQDGSTWQCSIDIVNSKVSCEDR
jgi:hypothetical protein